jgi:hypothetical protein
MPVTKLGFTGGEVLVCLPQNDMKALLSNIKYLIASLNVISIQFKMKHLSSIILAVLMSVTIPLAGQYGRRTYSHNIKARISSANAHHGVVTAGFAYNSLSTEPNFVINRADYDGGFSFSSQFPHYTNEYTIVDFPCPNLPTTRILNCQGIAVTGNKNTQLGERVMVVGTFNTGVFWCALDLNGDIMGQPNHFHFPNGGTTTEKPYIVKSKSNNSTYYICATFTGGCFVGKLTGLGVDWLRWYNFPLWPRGIIESPFNSNEVVVVGRAELNSQWLAAEAFFMKLNTTTGQFVSMKCYSDGSNGDDWFTSIEEAHANTSAALDGYIIGGRSLSLANNNNNYNNSIPWMIKLDPNGNVIWSKLIQHSFAGDIYEISDVVERDKGNNVYEYYGVGEMTNATGTWAGVWKLNHNGNPTTSPNEFRYPLGGPSSGYLEGATQLELWNQGNAPTGLFTWGTEYTSNERHVLNKTCFNGAVGCSEVLSDFTTKSGPSFITNITVAMNGIAVPCDAMMIYVNHLTPNSPQCSGWGVPSTCSNARFSTLTDLREHPDTETSPIRVFPTLTSGKVNIMFDSADGGNDYLQLRSVDGKLIHSVSLGQGISTDNSVEIDLRELGVSPGMYLITVQDNRGSHTYKVNYSE